MKVNEEAVAIKDREHKTWTSVAPGWRKHDERLVEITAPVTERMLDLAKLESAHRILDLACGTGEPALAAASRAKSGSVVALDFVEEMLEFAREKADTRGLHNIEFQKADAEELRFSDSSFDVVTVRFGLMFMPEPLNCLKKAYRVLKPGGHIVGAVWSSPKENLWASMPMGIIRRELGMEPPPPGNPGLFAFADKTRLESIMREAGFHHVSVEPVKVRMSEFDSGKEYFDWTLDLAGPVAMLFREIPKARQTEVRGEIEREAGGSDGRVVFDGVAWVVHGEK